MADAKQKELFDSGLKLFNDRKFYDAHEYWEELWLNYQLKDAICIQGLIQLSVSYFHYHNGNPKGAKSMVTKSIKKFTENADIRGIKKCELLPAIKRFQSFLEGREESDIIDSYYITLKVYHEK